MKTRKLIAICVVAFLMILPVWALSTTPVNASGARGKVCNKSSSTIWLTIEKYKNPTDKDGIWMSYRLEPGACTNTSYHDVEGIWGRECDSKGNYCWYQLWKVGASSLNVVDGYTSPIPPGSALYIQGVNIGGGWVADPRGIGWELPTSVNSINYTLKR
jgi:hypothetical protein